MTNWQKKQDVQKKRYLKLLKKDKVLIIHLDLDPIKPHSWGIARLASAITSGKAAAIDYKILEEGCNKNSKALKLAKKAKIKHGYGTRKVAKTKLF